MPESHLIVSEHLSLVYNVPFSKIGIITGPCHAEEVALEKLSYLTVACKNKEAGESMRKSLDTNFVKAKLSNDNMGVEYAAMLKNIYAIVVGISNGLGYGDNFQAVLISNSIREIESFIDALHPIHRDTKTSAYLGDLLVTAYSKFSRNRTFGFMIGKGYSVKAAKLEMNMVAEGYYAVKSLHSIKKEFKVDMPILEFVYNVLYAGKSAKKELNFLTDKLD